VLALAVNVRQIGIQKQEKNRPLLMRGTTGGPSHPRLRWCRPAEAPQEAKCCRKGTKKVGAQQERHELTVPLLRSSTEERPINHKHVVAAGARTGCTPVNLTPMAVRPGFVKATPPNRATHGTLLAVDPERVVNDARLGARIYLADVHWLGRIICLRFRSNTLYGRHRRIQR
jgi:hypothetical protein